MLGKIDLSPVTPGFDESESAPEPQRHGLQGFASQKLAENGLF
jgi:hypothetical protein